MGNNCSDRPQCIQACCMPQQAHVMEVQAPTMEVAVRCAARAPRCMPLTLRHAARTRGRRAAAVGGVAGRHGQHLS
jgi:hypothetical protein